MTLNLFCYIVERELWHCWQFWYFPDFTKKVLKCNAISNSQCLRWEMERLLLWNINISFWNFEKKFLTFGISLARLVWWSVKLCKQCVLWIQKKKIAKKNSATKITIRGQLSGRGHQANTEGSGKGGKWPPDHVGPWKLEGNITKLI